MSDTTYLLPATVETVFPNNDKASTVQKVQAIIVRIANSLLSVAMLNVGTNYKSGEFEYSESNFMNVGKASSEDAADNFLKACQKAYNKSDKVPTGKVSGKHWLIGERSNRYGNRTNLKIGNGHIYIMYDACFDSDGNAKPIKNGDRAGELPLKASVKTSLADVSGFKSLDSLKIKGELAEAYQAYFESLPADDKKQSTSNFGLSF